MIIFWLVAFVLFLIIEAATASLASIWFALGALVALISTALGAPLWMQIAWFIVVSAVTLYFTRPLAKKIPGAEAERHKCRPSDQRDMCRD